MDLVLGADPNPQRPESCEDHSRFENSLVTLISMSCDVHDVSQIRCCPRCLGKDLPKSVPSDLQYCFADQSNLRKALEISLHPSYCLRLSPSHKCSRLWYLE